MPFDNVNCCARVALAEGESAGVVAVTAGTWAKAADGKAQALSATTNAKALNDRA